MRSLQVNPAIRKHPSFPTLSSRKIQEGQMSTLQLGRTDGSPIKSHKKRRRKKSIK
jgi:hypothetical protein